MYIPLWPPLSPGQRFAPRQGTLSQQHPFNHPERHDFWYARNGLYFLARRLVELGVTTVAFPAYCHGIELKAIQAGGLRPVYYNVHRDASVDFEDLEQVLAQHRPGVIYVIHYDGFPQDMDRVMALKSRYGGYVIEDAALSLFARYQGRDVGNLGDASVFCLYKTLPIPAGAALLVNHPDLKVQVRQETPEQLSVVSRQLGLYLGWINGQTNGAGAVLQRMKSQAGQLFKATRLKQPPMNDLQFDVERARWGMPSVAAAVIDRTDVEQVVRRRQENFRHLLRRIQGIPGVTSLFTELPAGAVPLFFPAMVEARDSVASDLQQHGVECMPFWRDWPAEIPSARFPDVAYLRGRVLELPIHQSVTARQIDWIADRLTEAVAAVQQPDQPFGASSHTA